ncbi:MAG: 2-oxoacid:acceptor oxidoreductase subunit alpha [Thermoplasmata archaeon]|nr:2-oxoacid:acceptor oxidoreductase subunit alpha [Thermoplasmata archaeon]MCI4359033.1 2-oxoacid:acceptor oxidoreductase subunit alpha [Thermoplasmata archaeon]
MTTPAVSSTSTISAGTARQAPASFQELSDLSVMIGGQGGDGTLTVSDLLGRYFRRRGLYVYSSRNVLSRIRGGHADASVRASKLPVAAEKATVNLLLAFDHEAIDIGRAELDADGLILYDSSSFQSDAPDAIGFPFATLVGGQVGQPIYKNTAAYGAISIILGLDPILTSAVIEDRFQRRGAEALEKNLKALEIGRRLALDRPELVGRWSVADGDAHDRILITGNHAVALGFVVGGGRFFAGYPITPATEVMEYLMRYLPALHGVARQAEDELAAINMIIGASYAGARVMTSTSGPGLSLMTEGIGHAGAAEIPIVVADCQRVGPSTGEPTRHEQSDLSHLANLGHGEFPRLILAPGTIEDCFQLTGQALNLAEKWRLPVILLLDQALCQNAVTAAPFDLSAARIDRGDRLTAEDLQKMTRYGYYQYSAQGFSPYAPPGTPGGIAQVTGNEHDEMGHVSVNPVNRAKMMEKRMGKMVEVVPELPSPSLYAMEGARTGIIGYGSTWGPIREAQEILRHQDLPTTFYQARTLFPVPTPSLGPFLDSVDVAFIVEHNYTGQFARLVREHLPEHHRKLRSIVKYDGMSFRAPEIARRVQES